MSVLSVFCLCYTQTKGQHTEIGYCQGAALGRHYLRFRLVHFMTQPEVTSAIPELLVISAFTDSTPHSVKGVPFASYTGCV